MAEEVQNTGTNPTNNIQPTTTTGIKKPSGDGSSYSMNTQVGNTTELRERAPEVYSAMVRGIATSMINKMRAAQERLKKMMREARHR